MIDQEINTVAILANMKPGQSYDARQLATKFGASTSEMRRVLNLAVQRGVIESVGVRRRLKYRAVQQRFVAPPLKPMTISPEMRAAMARCAELRKHASKY